MLVGVEIETAAGAGAGTQALVEVETRATTGAEAGGKDRETKQTKQH